MMEALQTEITRRTLLRLGIMASAASLLPEAHASTSVVPYHGLLRELAPGTVLPEGWLRAWLTLQAEGLASHLPEVSWPFTQDYWGEEHQGAYFTAEQEYEVWWPWEQKAYWLDGATRLGVLLKHNDLLSRSTAPLAYTMAHPDREGYLGPEAFQDPLADYHRWPHVVFFRALAAAYDAQLPLTGVSRTETIDRMARHYLQDQASYGKPKRNVHNVETMLWCYASSGDARLLKLAEEAWAEYRKYADDAENADLGTLRVEGNTPINAHGETYAECSKQPAILYLYTGRPEYLRFAEQDQRRIFDHHMLVDGVPSTSEWFSTVTALDSHETCDIADHTWTWGYMLQATGDGVWADRIERACFNAGMGAIKKDWRALQYFSCPNQVLATLHSDHNWPKFKEHGMGMMAYQPNPGERTACCGGNVHRIFPNYIIHMWMSTANHGIAAVLYGPSIVRLPLGRDKQLVTITQETHYPFEEQVRFRINCDRPVAFPLALRVPGWCRAARVAVNGKPEAITPNEKGFAVIERVFHPGDTITLDLPMHVAVTHWPQNGMALERGPLVYSLPIEAKWTSTVEPRYTTAEYPAWEAMPTSPWNYALAFNPERLDTQLTVSVEKPSTDPWAHPPVRITVPARRVLDWSLQLNPDDSQQMFTPPLPDLSTAKLSNTVERITLVPLGSTHLRLTTFPNAGASRSAAEA